MATGSRSLVGAGSKPAPAAFSWALGLAIALLGLAALPAVAQPTGAERAPKTALELDRQAERVRNRDLAARRERVPPLRTKSLRQALVDLAGGASTLPRDLALAWSEQISAEGLYYVGLEASVPQQAGYAEGEDVVFFGVVADGHGKEVLSFELRQPLLGSRLRLLADVPLYLEPGEYSAAIGLARGKRAERLAIQPLAPQPIDAQAFSVSRPLLADDLFPLAVAQQPDEPFAFGGIKVPPLGGRPLLPGDELWLFLVVRNPRTEAGAPRLALTASLRPSGGNARQRLPLPKPVPAALQGFVGQWGVGFQLRLDRYPPGEYELEVEVKDELAGETRTARGNLVIAAPAP